MGQHEVKYACEEHVDMAIDDILYSYETFPVMETSEEHKCEYCCNDAMYKITI